MSEERIQRLEQELEARREECARLREENERLKDFAEGLQMGAAFLRSELAKTKEREKRYGEALEWACDTCWGKEHCLDRQDQKRCLIFRALHPKEGEK